MDAPALLFISGWAMKINKFIVLYLVLSVVGAAFSFLFASYNFTASKAVLTESENAKTIKTVFIIDAGHGGEDGGASGINGILEKDLNLEIAFTVCDILKSAGIDAVMTRTEDKLLYKESEDIKGYRKQYDLKNRMLFARRYENPVFVSIHMNTFGSSKYSGFQVYYSPNNAESTAVADILQSNVIKYLQSDNTRKIKRAKSNIYLLDRLSCPAVLAECGFLSNFEECMLLSDINYRKKLSAVIAASLMEYLYSNRLDK